MYEWIKQEAQALQPTLTAWRRALHQIPEVDMNLTKTSAYVQEQLTALGIPFRVLPDGSGVTAVLGQGEPCILLRADMDGLPVEELSGLPFASQNGCMHACGHDMHAASLLGAAAILKQQETQLKGTVKLLFQPGEETFHGAQAAVDGGVLEMPQADAAFALHVNSAVPCNTLLYGTNTMASVFGFKITLTGVGGHGSAPDTCIDPINTGVHIYLGLQELIARECPPSAEAALTIGQFSAGEMSNIIPQTAVLQGTLRTFGEDVQNRMIARIRQVAEGIAAVYRTDIRFEELCNIPGVVCEKALNQMILEAAAQMDPTLNLQPGLHVMASEDFAVIAGQVPSSYIVIGAAETEGEIFQQHNPRVRFHEDALVTGAALYACAALRYLV